METRKQHSIRYVTGYAVVNGKPVWQQKTPEYTAYLQAKGRCTNPRNTSFARYGGKGIEFRFSSFEQFLDVLGRRPSGEYSLDRIDSKGHYEPGNVRWADDFTQAQNRSVTIWLTLNGETRCVREWSRTLGISAGTIQNRINRRWCHPCSLSNRKQVQCSHVQHGKRLKVKLSPSDLLEIRRLVSDRVSHHDIARRFGISFNYVRRAAKKGARLYV